MSPSFAVYIYVACKRPFAKGLIHRSSTIAAFCRQVSRIVVFSTDVTQVFWFVFGFSSFNSLFSFQSQSFKMQ
jgi:hypothetical protein